MRRRELIAGLGSAAAWPLAARAQQPAMPVIGILRPGSAVRPPDNPAFFQGLSEMGYVEGRNVAIEFRGAEQYDQLVALAADLVRLKVAVIYASTTANSAMAAKAATTTIPIVFGNGSDPIRVGLVPSLSRPGGNITGVTYFISEVLPQRLQYLRELVPAAAVGTIAFLTNPINPLSKPDTSDILAAAQKIGQQIRVLTASAPLALAAIQALPRPLMRGSIAINMHRAPVRLDRFDGNDRAFIVTYEAIRKWAARCNLNRDPEMPEGFYGRLADNWRPLLAIADDFGYGQAARAAAGTLSSNRQYENPTITLLTDTRTVFDMFQVDRLRTKLDLIPALVGLEGGLWET
jgi:hypothetical protein